MTRQVKRGRPTQKQEARLVAWANRERKKVGKRPIKKLPCEQEDGWAPRTCPMAVALGVEVGYQHAGLNIDLPAYVTRFIVCFDDGKYPELGA